MRYTLLLKVFILNCFPVVLQGQQIDSLAFDSLGYSYFDLSESFPNDYDSCYYYTALALDNFRKSGNSQMEVLSINGLAILRRRQERFMEADSLITEALRKAEEFQILSDLNSDYALNTAGVIKQRKGDYSKSTLLLFQAINQHQKRKGTKFYDKELVGNIYQTLGQNFHHTGDYEESIGYLEKAYQIQSSEHAEEELPVVRILLSLGVAHGKAGRLAKAEELLTQGFRKLPNEAEAPLVINKKIEFAINLAGVLSEANKFGEAIGYAKQALQLKGSNQYYYHGLIYEEMGKAYLGKKDFGRSYNAFQRALEYKEKHYKSSPTHPILALAYNDLATILLAQNKAESALPVFQDALTTISPGSFLNSPTKAPAVDEISSPFVGLSILSNKVKALSQYGLAHNDPSYLEAALTHYEVISGLIQKNRQSFQSEASKRLLSAEVITIYQEAVELAIELYNKQPEQRYLEQAFRFAEANKAAILLEELQADQALGRETIPDSIRIKEQEFAISISFLKKSILEARENKQEQERISSLEDQKFKIEQNQSQLIRQIEREFPEYYGLKYQPQVTSIKDLQEKLLQDGQGLVEYFFSKEKLYSFLITKDEVIVEVVPNWGQCQKQAFELRKLLGIAPNSQSFKADLSQLNQLGYSLYQSLLGPLLDGRTTLQSLIFVPDRELGYLPFEVLNYEFDPEDSPYNSSLLTKYSISYAYSTQLLLNQPTSRQSPSSTTPLLAYAPSFGTAIAEARASCTADELYSLQCSQGEVEEISSIWSGEAVTGLDATLAAFMEQAAQARILHLATHACIDEKNSERNKIFFSDQALTGIDLQAMKIQPELTILSACNTGTGQLARGEGILSLARDFRLAGSPSTLTSLWSVDDCATSKIMTRYHQHLFQGKSKPEALRAAKLDFLAKADKEQSHPYFWAAFVQYGDISPLRSPGFPIWLIYGGLALLTVGLLYVVQKRKPASA